MRGNTNRRPRRVAVGAGVLALSGANTYSGDTSIAAGTLRAGAANTLSAASTTTVAAGATLDLNNLNQSVGALGGAGTVTLGSAALTAGGNDASTTFSGVISGTGSLEKTGAGTLTLTNTNTFTGGTTISGGTLQLGNGGTTGSIAGAIANSGTLAINRSDTVTLGLSMAGTGSLQQAGSGTTVLTGSNTYTGTTTISNGTLQVGTGGATGTLGSGAVFNNGALVFNRSGSLVVSSDISGTGSVTQSGSGTTVLTGNNSYAGTTTIAGGTLQVGNGGTSGTLGSGAVINNGQLVFNRADTMTVASAISGTGSLSQVGSGTTILTGTNSYSGNTNVTAGTLVVSGTLTSSHAVVTGSGHLIVNGNVNSGTTVDTTGILSGSGMVLGDVLMQGTLKPGNSIGTLTINGNYQQTAGSTFQVEVNPAGQGDKIVVNGAATLNGGTVQVLPAPGLYARNTYTILSATGGVSGTFASVANSFAFLTTSLSYDPNNVYLTLALGSSAFSNGAQTGNQRAVGQALDQGVAGATGDFATVLAALEVLNAQQGPAALNAISGQPYANVGSANLGSSLLFMNALGRQMSFNRQPTGGDGARVALAEACLATCDAPAQPLYSAWATAIGGTGSILGNANAGTLTYSLGGFAAGLDRRFSPEWLAGVSIGTATGNQYVDGFIGSATTTSFQASLYSSFTAGAFYLDSLAGYGYGDNQMTRSILIPGLGGRTARSRSGSNQLFAQAEAGYRFLLDDRMSAGLTPFLRFQAASANGNGFTEWGADSLNLSVLPQTTTSIRTVLGAQADAALDLGWREKLAVQFRLGWGYEYADTTRPMTAAFAGAPAAAFTVYGAQPQRSSVVLGLGLDTDIAESTSVYLRYDGEVGAGFDRHTLGVGLRLRW